MAHYYHLPHDLYCWGQDRGGTLIPLVSQIFIKIFHLSALTSVSFSNYILLLIGYLCFASLFKSFYSKILFGLIWFLPFQRFIDLLRFPIGVEYSLIALVIFLVTKLDDKITFKRVKNHLLIIAIIFVSILAIWVSDLAMVTIVLLLFILFIYAFIERRNTFLNKTVISYLIIGLISCFVLITYAKSFAGLKTEHYLTLNNIVDIKRSLHILFTKYIEVLTFQTRETLVSIYFYCIILFLISSLFYIVKKKLFLILISDKWFVFFITDFVAIFGTFLISSWVLSNEMGRWYFVASYISLSLAILLAIEISSQVYQIKFIKILFLIIVLLGSISPLYTMQVVRPKSLKPMVEVVGEFKQLGEIGIIGEFWNSFLTSCPDPEMIKAVTHDQCYMRNPKLVDMVFERKNLYVIKDMWMEEFPDTLQQYGYILVKEGNQFNLGNCDVCKYNKIKLHKKFVLNKLNNLSQASNHHSDVENELFIASNCNSCKESYVMHGPNIPIGIGEFAVKFHIKATNITKDYSIARLDVTSDGGAIILLSKDINKADFSNNEYNYINLDFKTLKRHNNIEFRIYFYGNADIYIDQVELKEN